ncbi:uncharacterized protein ZBAI_04785 [Zygosaccharomyces bailii ISA1307]|nr:uncharacterized protein ZBAI_04785 [Zygosaccharomyces bailii ISA1307]
MEDGRIVAHEMSNCGEPLLLEPLFGAKPFTSSVETLLEDHIPLPRLCYQCGKMSPSWTDSHASSPTVVNERYEMPLPNGAVTDFWTATVRKVFYELPYASSDRFLERFHYTVISSDLLGDLNRWRISDTIISPDQQGGDWCSLPSKSMSAHISSLLCWPTHKNLQATSATKLCLNGNFDYLSTLSYVRKTLKRLKGVKGSRRRILAVLLIVLRLTFQQEYLRAQFTKHRALASLKSILDSLQSLSILHHKYFVASKEICEQSSPRIYGTVKNLLVSSIDLLYYSMEKATQQLLSVCDTSELTKYCGIYDVALPELFYRLTEPAIDVESRLSRVRILRKFMLCCLLSQNQNHGRSVCDLPMCNLLRKVFPSQTWTAHISELERLRLVTCNLQKLRVLTSSLITSLVQHTEIFGRHSSLMEEGQREKRYSRIYSPSNNDESSKKSLNATVSPTKLSMTLHGLRDLEKLLIVSNGDLTVNDSTSKIVRERLADLLQIWQESISIPEIQRQEKRPSLNKFGNRGLSLDVVKNPVEFNLACGGPQAPKLDDQVDITNIDDAQSDLELDSDYEVFITEATDMNSDENEDNNENYTEDNEVSAEPIRKLRSSEKTFIDTQTERYRGFTDEELRKKLTEGILKLAEENRQGRQKLRTQKSFELLRQDKSNDWTTLGAVRQISSASELTLKSSILNHKVSTEETIPIFYELQELMDK